MAPQLPTLEDHRAIELLLTPSGNAVTAGALLVDIRRGTFLVVHAKATLLATGAGPTMYKMMAPSARKPPTAWPWPTGQGRVGRWRWCSSIPRVCWWATLA